MLIGSWESGDVYHVGPGASQWLNVAPSAGIFQEGYICFTPPVSVTAGSWPERHEACQTCRINLGGCNEEAALAPPPRALQLGPLNLNLYRGQQIIRESRVSGSIVSTKYC